ncbi:indolepyruvate ferredoxin oxidoreductase family protein [Thalassospiraceae bacterium LMO-JJ14]|nr:indolepyruvate ferredoxin oxidoreductase family protein [Thalassospiraceae bacterium LMO-JJ14]
MSLIRATLDDKYTLETGRVYLTGTQALVRLTLMQKALDRAHGRNTAGYVTGYRGSPLGALDQEFGQARHLLEAGDIKFQPAVNEDLAATALWGTQQVNMFEGAKFDGVFGIWYGKGPGVDRTGDVFRHANMAGTAPLGGVLALAGDDPACKSSTVPSQSEYAFTDVMIPFLHPANVEEILQLGLIGIQMSRYSGLWVGLKCITDNIDTSASVDIGPHLYDFAMPEDFQMPEDGLHIRWPDQPLDQEKRLHRHKIYAALAFARANKLNRITIDNPKARLGICATGKSYMDVLQALDDLGIDEEHAAEIGIRLFKITMPWPLERESARHFAEGLDEILVVEEKRAVIENQLKEQLYNWREDVRPRVVGKFDENGEWILPSAGELTPAMIARAIAKRIEQFHTSDRIKDRLAFLTKKEQSLATGQPNMKRIPYFCAGCPHNTSTKVPEGSRAAAGIGCHYMAIWMDRETETFTHMGGEGVNWVGQAPFTETRHIFANIGDGTYFHSGLLAIRAAVSSGVTMTYKILYNDAVAMTGGQTHDGTLNPAIIAQQIRAEGVERIVVVSDEPDKYPINYGFPAGVDIYHREELDQVQRDLRTVSGVSALIYDQTCAAEKRRRRKRGLFPDPARRVFINEAVCEGCGDCGVASNCVAITPKDTELGRKRAIDQSACNKDYSCLNGFCPSFVTVEDTQVKKPKAVGDAPFPALPEPATVDLSDPYNVVVTGIGGTGVVTIGAILGMAAHLESLGVSVLDVAGLAQKNGMVYSHLRFAAAPHDIHAVRISAGGADLLLGCDMVSSGDPETLAKLRAGNSKAVINEHQTMTADFTRYPDMMFPDEGFKRTIREETGPEAVDFIEATALARKLLGDTIAANMMVVGYAYQKGLLPVSAEAIERAIELNGVAVDFNKQAFLWGRRAAHDLAAVEAIVGRFDDKPQPFELEGFVDRRVSDLIAFQNKAYADRYADLVKKIRAAEASALPGSTALSEAVARALFKLMAYKDEYEVARLYTDGRFEQAIAETFAAGGRVKFHLAPPLFAERDPASGHLKKKEYGPWIMPVFRMLAGLKGLRGTIFDPFGYSAERKTERRLISEYETQLEEIATGLNATNHGAAVQLASLPMRMRGFGHVKEANVRAAKACEGDLIATFRDPSRAPQAAE